MYKFLLGGWVARPSAFYFLRLRWFLVFGVCLAVRGVPCVFAVLNPSALGRCA